MISRPAGGRAGIGTILTVLTFSAVAACSQGQPTAPPAASLAAVAEPTPSTAVPPSEAPAEAIAPFTGLGATREQAERPAVAVVLSGEDPVGLNRADLIYQEFSDVPRWLALFQSGDATVGPVSGARPLDPMLLSVLRPVLVFAGAPNGVLQVIRTADLEVVDSADSQEPFEVDGDRVLASTKELRAAAGTTPAPVKAMQYVSATADPPAGRQRAGRVTVTVPGHGRQTWDHASAGWRSDAAPDLVVQNLVVQFSEYKEIQLQHPDGPRVPSARALGAGRAVVATDGQVLEGVWRKAGVRALATYADDHGVLARLVPGRTLVLLVPPGSEVDAG